MSMWCDKKKKWISQKKANRKCVRLNVKKRGMICPHLSLSVELPSVTKVGGCVLS